GHRVVPPVDQKIRCHTKSQGKITDRVLAKPVPHSLQLLIAMPKRPKISPSALRIPKQHGRNPIELLLIRPFAKSLHRTFCHCPQALMVKYRCARRSPAICRSMYSKSASCDTRACFKKPDAWPYTAGSLIFSR